MTVAVERMQRDVEAATTNTRMVHAILSDNPDVAICGAAVHGPILDGGRAIDCVVCAEICERVYGKRLPS